MSHRNPSGTAPPWRTTTDLPLLQGCSSLTVERGPCCSLPVASSTVLTPSQASLRPCQQREVGRFHPLWRGVDPPLWEVAPHHSGALVPFQLPILLKGTSDDDVPCPGYLFEEIASILPRRTVWGKEQMAGPRAVRRVPGDSAVPRGIRSSFIIVSSHGWGLKAAVLMAQET